MLRKLPIVGVFGQGTRITPERAALAKAVGASVARLRAHLLTGGGFGVMEAAAEGFVSVDDRPGFSIGIIPCHPTKGMDKPNCPDDGTPYPNAFVEIPIYTPLLSRVAEWRTMPGRNHVNVLSADAIIALPGSTGTANELLMAQTYRDEMTRPREQRRTVLIGPLEQFTTEQREAFVHAETLADAERHVRAVFAARSLVH